MTSGVSINVGPDLAAAVKVPTYLPCQFFGFQAAEGNDSLRAISADTHQNASRRDNAAFGQFAH